MDIFLPTLLRGTMWGAMMGAGMGTLSGILAMNKTELPNTISFQHPASHKMVVLDTFGLDPEQCVIPLLNRVRESLHVDPKIRELARRQFVVILARIRRFYLAMKVHLQQPDIVKFKLLTRNHATSAAQSITNFESYIWDSMELQDIMQSLETVKQTIINKALTLDR